MSTMRPASAKIIHHSTGMGTPDVLTVRQRAEELARIDGRQQFNETDWHQAKRELHGGHETNDTNGNMDAAALVSERDMIATSTGHQVENMGLEDQENVLEELIAEGMDEAVHEQMLAARREEETDEDLEEEE
jgi:hypothetical protein